MPVIAEAIRSGPDLGSILRGGGHSQLAPLLTGTDLPTAITTKFEKCIDSLPYPNIRSVNYTCWSAPNFKTENKL